jgi:release factor glutamine methyltransferase
MSTPGDTAPWTVGRLLDWTTRWFREHEVEGGRLAAELLLAQAMGCRKIELYTRYELEPSDEQRSSFRELVRQAGNHVPVAYLLGHREFFSLDFIVSAAVLVPRPETEVLVQRAIDLCRQAGEHPMHVLDIGTGSGCIAVALARYAKNALLVGSDVSADALDVAAENVKQHGLAERIQLVQADCAAIPPDVVPAGGFNLVVSNPPYISDAEWETLPPNVRCHEPRLALTGPGGDGLEMYRRLARETPPVMAPGGRLLAELGHNQHAAVLEIFATGGLWHHRGTYRDRSDPHDRVAEFELR